MQLANEEALRFNHEYIGTEHILLGLVAEGSGVAATVLKNLDIELRKIRDWVEKICLRGPGGEPPFKGRRPHTPRTKKVIDYAVEEARRLNHNYIGSEHLLLGLLREEEGVAAQVLINLGLKLEVVREEIKKLLGLDMPGTQKVLDETLIISEPEPVLEPGTVIRKHLKRLRIQLEQVEEQKSEAVNEQDFDRAARWRDVAVVYKQLIALYEGLNRQQ
jgi:ATP-dependent Clp protease ATP-binding subunit ClpA